MNTMSRNVTQRSVERVDDPPVETGMLQQHRVRQLVRPGNWAQNDPFLLLIEDRLPAITSGGHPHPGIETVSYVIEGELEHRDSSGHDPTSIEKSQVVWLTRTDTEQLTEVMLAAAAHKSVELLLLAGRPLHESVAVRGSFVMNTEEQIREAFADFLPAGLVRWRKVESRPTQKPARRKSPRSGVENVFI